MKKTLKVIFTGSLMVAVGLLFISNSMKAQQTSSKTQEKTVLEVINSKENTSEFAGLLKQSGYAQIVKKKGPYTILAPTNEAIQNSDSKLKENPKKLMKGQLFQGNVPKDQVESQMGVKVKETDKSASNGVVYVVDKVVNR